MKMSKKKIFVVALAVCVIAVMSMGSLAWFNDADQVTNKFMIADSTTTTNPDEVFGVDLYEVKDGQNYDTGITYQNVLPGGTYEKKPIVKNTGKYSEYIRVIVTISDKAAWMASIDAKTQAELEAYDITKHFIGYNAADWQEGKTTTEYVDDTIKYTLYLKDALEPGKEYTVFNSVTLPTTMTVEDTLLFGGDFTIDLVAQAVQTDFVGDNCYDAFKTAYPAA